MLFNKQESLKLSSYQSWEWHSKSPHPHKKQRTAFTVGKGARELYSEVLQNMSGHHTGAQAHTQVHSYRRKILRNSKQYTDEEFFLR